MPTVFSHLLLFLLGDRLKNALETADSCFDGLFPVTEPPPPVFDKVLCDARMVLVEGPILCC